MKQFLAITVLCTVTTFAQTTPVNQLTPAEEAAGWVLLFDGIDKEANWRSGENGDNNNWTIEDGAMKSPSGGDMVFTRDSYDNFEYSLEWKLNEAGNSGIFWRVAQPPGWYCSGPEYGILDNENGGDRNAMGHIGDEENMPIKTTGTSYDIYTTKAAGHVDSPYVDHTKPYDEWNHGVVWADGDHIEHWLNGYKVVDYITGTAEWEERYSYSKFSPGCGDEYGKHPSGLIGMQGHGGGLLVWYRNIKIRSFTPGEKLASPIITTAEGVFFDSLEVSMEVAITGAKIYYTIDGTDPTASSNEYTGPFMLYETSTVKAVTDRETFQTSDAASQEIVVNSSIGITDKVPVRLSWRTVNENQGGRITFSGLTADNIKTEILDIQGSVITSAMLGRSNSTVNYTGKLRGIYLLKMTHPEFSLSRKMLFQ